MTTKTAKPRNRSMELNEESAVTKMLRELATEAYKLNIVQNAAKRDYEKKRAELLGKMKAAKLTTQVFEGVMLTDKTEKGITLEVKVETPVNEKADVRKLQKLVDDDTFLTIVAAAKGAITTFAGTAVFEQCKVLVEGEENVSVKLLKE